MRIGVRELLVGSRDPRVEVLMLALEAVERLAAVERARLAERRVDDEQQRTVRREAPGGELD